MSLELYMTFTIAAASVAIIAFILLLHLSMFHIYINYVGITTYEYVRAVRISMDQNNSTTSANNFLEDLPPITTLNTTTNHNNLGSEKGFQNSTSNSIKCCTFFSKKKAKVGPTNNTVNNTNSENGKNPLQQQNGTITHDNTTTNGNNSCNGGGRQINNPPSNKKITDEKLPPIHAATPMATPKSPKRYRKGIDIHGKSTISSSSVPKLPKLVEESNINNEHLTRVNEHLEKMEDQDKIYVIEVK